MALPRPSPSLYQSPTFAALRHHNYRLFFGGQLCSLIGSWMQMTAQSWLVTLLAGGPKSAGYWLGLVSTVGALPMLFGSIFGGVVADRYARRTIIVCAQAAQGLLALGLALLVATGAVQLWHLPLFACLLGITNVFDIPARQSFVVEMVGKEDLPNAIGLNSSLFNTARVVGPTVATLLIAALSRSVGETKATAYCFLVNGLSYGAVIVSLLRMRGDFSPRAAGKESPLRQLREAASYLRDSPAALSLLALLVSSTLFLTAEWVLLPSLARFTLGADARRFGTLMMLKGLGALVAALTVATLSAAGKRGRMLTLAALTWPLSALAIALSRRYDLTCVLLPLLGFSVVTCLTTANTLLQTSTPDALRGRVMGVHAFILMGLTPIGSYWAGWVAGRADAPTAVALGSVAALIVAVGVIVRFPALRRADHTLSEERSGERAG